MKRLVLTLAAAATLAVALAYFALRDRGPYIACTYEHPHTAAFTSPEAMAALAAMSAEAEAARQYNLGSVRDVMDRREADFIRRGYPSHFVELDAGSVLERRSCRGQGARRGCSYTVESGPRGGPSAHAGEVVWIADAFVEPVDRPAQVDGVWGCWAGGPSGHP